MLEWFNNRGLRTFCHLRDERSFNFGNELHSLICHRCSGIYSAFLVFFIVAVVFNYRGHFSKKIKPFGIAIFGAGLLSLSGIQVLIQKVSNDPILTSGSTRFIIGSLTGLGLLHLYYGLQEPKEPEKAKPWIFGVFFVILCIHTFISHISMFWISISSMSGLVFVYVVMNQLVIESFVPKSTTVKKALLVLGFISLEWTFLFWNNVLKHQYG